MDKATDRIIQGDCLAVLPTLPEDSVHCVVTSPPYFALRSYLPGDHPDKAREIGAETTPGAFIATMVAVFREVRRVLRPDGVLFLNLGDSYGQGTCGGDSPVGRRSGRATDKLRRQEIDVTADFPGQIQNLPHRVAEALRADGWIWRQTIVWAKRSPMPESVQGWRWERCRVKVKSHQRNVGYSNSTEWRPQSDSRHTGPYGHGEWQDCPGCPKCEKAGGYVLRRGAGRCTNAHEYIFVLAKSDRYFWDSIQSREESGETRPARPFGGTAANRKNGDGSDYDYQGDTGTRNPRTVWTLSAEPTSEQHFATFPTELVFRCLRAGVSGGGCCSTCGDPWAPVVEASSVVPVDAGGKSVDLDPNANWRRANANLRARRLAGCPSHDNPYPPAKVLGYRATCDCGTDAVGCTVLDPFAGLCTVGQVAHYMGHRFVGVELNAQYVAIARKRIKRTPRCFLRRGEPPTIDPDKHPLLFEV